MNEEIEQTPPADASAAPEAAPEAHAEPVPSSAEAVNEVVAPAEELAPTPAAPQADPEPPAQDVPPPPAPHPADSLLQRLENEVDSLLHSPLALANWVKDMAREARKLL